MKLATSAALLLAGAGLVACGSSHVDPRKAIVQVVRNWERQQGDEHMQIAVRISESDPKYAIAQEEIPGYPNGKVLVRAWILERTGSRWQADIVGLRTPPACSVPATVRRELFRTAACTPPPIIGYRSIPWTRGRSVRMRYCESPGFPGNFVATSKEVTCRVASIVTHALETRCYQHGRCAVHRYVCRAYWNGRFGSTFSVVHHALCTNSRRRILRRIEWDGG